MVAEVMSGMVQGVQGEVITVQVDISDGLPVFCMIGHLSPEVKEARERVRTALKNTGFRLPPRRISVNLAPADLKKSGTCFDLAIAAGVFAAMGLLLPERIRGLFFLGELALDGSVSPLTGVLPILAAARRAGFTRCIVPAGNMEEALLLEGMECLGFWYLKEVFRFLSGEEATFLTERDIPGTRREGDAVPEALPDLAQVRGQQMAKRALEIAVSGYHNLFLDGPPGAGKSMLASCVPGIMPKMSREEMIETTMLYSVKGLLKDGLGLVERRPFRAPSLSVTMAGMFGGGSVPGPGEISLAHHGVLFLDEFSEFRRELIEMFRVPLEEHQITQIRGGRSVVFPADFMLIAAANPCPCGYYPDRRYCRCSPGKIADYQNRLSGPILDRLDLFVRCDPVSYAMISGEEQEPGEPSEKVRERICRVWELQGERFRGSGIRFNGRMRQREVEKYCVLDKDSEKLLRQVFDSMRLTGRSYYRILKVGRTIADMEQSSSIREEHVREALMYRRMPPETV